MNYELVKQLKDSGFPQKRHGRFSKWLDSDGLATDYTESQHVESAYSPTLEELIEACVSFPETQFCLYGRDEDRWEVTEVSLSTIEINRTMQAKGFTYYGLTPSEAVARLWLALNKKK